MPCDAEFFSAHFVIKNLTKQNLSVKRYNIAVIFLKRDSAGITV